MKHYKDKAIKIKIDKIYKSRTMVQQKSKVQEISKKRYKRQKKVIYFEEDF